jgi:hypothetical protein
MRLESHSTSTWLKMSQARRFHARAATLVAIGLTLTVFLGNPAIPTRADELPPVVGGTEVFVGDDWSGFGLSGFDPVSYFLAPVPLSGREGIELIWGGLAWRFVSAANREAFEADPEIYAPRIGGYDATAAAEGRLAAADPALFAIGGNRLYLFRSERSRARFLADPSLTEKAEARWSDLKANLVRN